VSAIPTKEPVVSKPTLTVEIPIKFEFIFNANTFWSSVSVYPTPRLPSSDTIIPLPPFEEYVKTSPVIKLCSGK